MVRPDATAGAPDAFKVRRARIALVNTQGQEFTTDTDAGAYTSCGWDLAEGKVGSRMVIPLQFRKR